MLCSSYFLNRKNEQGARQEEENILCTEKADSVQKSSLAQRYVESILSLSLFRKNGQEIIVSFCTDLFTGNSQEQRNASHVNN